MSRQRGVALITALLVVVLGTLAVAAALGSTRIGLHRAQNLRDSETEWWYAKGVESWLKSILERDSEDNKYDSLADAWAKPVDYLPIDYGSIRGGLVDQQGLFNLNNFAATDTPAKKEFSKYAEQFERLLQNLEDADVAAARPLAIAIHDWIDPDEQPTGVDGAEDTEYLTRQPPYRTGNRYLQSVSEVLSVKGMTPKLYRQLLPYITVLPVSNTAININTAPEPVLRSMQPQVDAKLQAFIQERDKKPAETDSEVSQVIKAGGVLATCRSSYFMLKAEIFIGSGRLALYSFFYRPEQGAPVVLGRNLDSP